MRSLASDIMVCSTVTSTAREQFFEVFVSPLINVGRKTTMAAEIPVGKQGQIHRLLLMRQGCVVGGVWGARLIRAEG